MNQHDDQLTRLFNSLPRECAAADFTEKVLSKLTRRRPHPVFGQRRVLVVAIGLGLVAVCVSIFWQIQAERQRAKLRAELHAVRSEYQTITRQLKALEVSRGK